MGDIRKKVVIMGVNRPNIADNQTWSHVSIDEVLGDIRKKVVIMAKPIGAVPLVAHEDHLASGTSAVLGASLSERTKTATR